ncbi:hypothetical protein H2199_003866 [Coniosporium tulheliwenetii]|uniref:Uncharacterized protein n=1 Tax=Coniosporium tulheliwenetii TaxID=3383036 RepID=A0ACC2Z932_9PEZI|nr:hypothetical protein H2199_003866 [Cladosporium sp. JES 115]
MPPKRSLMMKNLRKHSQSTEPPSSPRPTREEADIALFNGIELLGRRYPERDFAIATCVLNHIEDDILAYFRRDGVECDRHLYEELELLAEARRRQLVRVRRNRGVHTGLDDYVSGRDNFSMPAYGTSAAKPVYIEDDEDVEDYGPVGEEGDSRELGSIEDAGEEDESESLVDEERSTRRRNRRLAEAPISSSHYWAEDDLEGMSAEDDSYSDYGQEYSKPASDGDYSEPASDGDDMETLSEEDDSDSQFYEDMIIGEIFDKGGPSTRGGVRPAEAPIHRPRYVPRDERIDKVTGEIWHADCPDNFPFGETRFMENYIGYTFSRDLAAAEAREKETGEKFNVSAAAPAEDILSEDEDFGVKHKEQEESDLALYEILNQPRYKLPDLPRDAEAQHRKMEEEGVFDDKHLKALEKEWPATMSEMCAKFDAVYGPKIRELNDAAVLGRAAKDRGKRKVYDCSPSPVKKARRR